MSLLFASLIDTGSNFIYLFIFFFLYTTVLSRLDLSHRKLCCFPRGKPAVTESRKYNETGGLVY